MGGPEAPPAAERRQATDAMGDAVQFFITTANAFRGRLEQVELNLLYNRKSKLRIP
jgi:hypothetical protein